jgi:hypothetical protein
MNNFDRVYNSILREGKADPANKKGTKESAPFQKHRNKLESRASSKASRRRGKREMVEEMFPLVGALARGAAMGLASSAVSNMMDGDDVDEDAEDFGDREGGNYKDPFTKLREDIEDYIDDLSSGMHDGDRSAAHTIAVELEDILQRNNAEEAEEY